MNEYILFDMDGTLLELDESGFEAEYMHRAKVFFEQQSPEKGKHIVKGIGQSVKAMRHNDTSYSNEEIFWQCVEEASGLQRHELEPMFEQYYNSVYAQIGDAYQANPDTIQIVETLARKGYNLVVATNPMLPQIANEYRLHWCQLEHINWREITGFENYSRCKPDPQYYQQICNRLHIKPQQCTMNGNSLHDDFPATEIGMDFYLLLDEHADAAEKNYTGAKGTRKDLMQLVMDLTERRQ